jgi:glycerate 2-kinase
MMTDDALAILRKAIDAVNPFTAVQAHLKLGGDEDGLSLTAGTYRYPASDVNDVLLVAFGKASSAMASSAVHRLEQAFPGKPIRGVVVVKDDHAAMEEMEVLQRHAIQVLEAAHPVPDRRSVQAAQQIMTLANEASAQTLVICCISGGGSALFCAPRPPLTLQDLQATNSALLKSGMSIHEMNVIRKRLETGKGGLLAAAAYPAQVLTLVLSDILGDPLDLIASGPTVPDPSTFRDALQLVHANNLDTVLPASVMSVLVKGLEDSSEDTPKGDSPVFERCNTVLVGNNELAVLAAADEASSRGYDPVILGTMMEGEARNVAGVYTAMVQHLKRGGKYPMSRLPSALIAGGETTVTIGNESGKGGRNQELALVAAQQLQALKLRDVVLASVGTDGTDGPTDAAGAVVDGATVDRLTGSVGDALGRHDAYTYLDQVDDEGHSPLIRTGPTGTNVADVCVILIK